MRCLTLDAFLQLLAARVIERSGASRPTLMAAVAHLDGQVRVASVESVVLGRACTAAAAAAAAAAVDFDPLPTEAGAVLSIAETAAIVIAGEHRLLGRHGSDRIGSDRR